jgi:hypothetical protein
LDTLAVALMRVTVEMEIRDVAAWVDRIGEAMRDVAPMDALVGRVIQDVAVWFLDTETDTREFATCVVGRTTAIRAVAVWVVLAVLLIDAMAVI